MSTVCVKFESSMKLEFRVEQRCLFQWFVIVGWIVSFSLALVVPYAPATRFCRDSDVCGTWTDAGGVAWETLFRPMWGIWVCWIILTCIAGYGGIIPLFFFTCTGTCTKCIDVTVFRAGFVNTFLSWNFFVPLGKLTYLGYLIHPIILLAFYLRYPVEYYFTDYFTVSNSPTASNFRGIFTMVSNIFGCIAKPQK